MKCFPSRFVCSVGFIALLVILLIRKMSHSHNHTESLGVGDTHTMKMYFAFSKSATVLFKQWNFDSMAGLIGSMVAVYAMAFAYEGLKFYRSYLLTSAISIRNKNRASGEERFTMLTILSKSHLIQTLFHGIQAVLSYFLMLVFMTYNGGLCLAVIFGLVCGYFVFGWRSPLVNSAIADDHCT